MLAIFILVLLAAAPPAAAQDPSEVQALLAAGRYAEAEERATARAAAAEAERARDPRAALDASLDLIEALIRNGHPDDRTLRLAERAAQSPSSIALDDRTVSARASRLLGALFIERGQPERALPHLDRALQIARALPDSTRGLLAETLDRRASALVLLQRYDEAQRAAEESFNIRRAASADPLDLARSRFLLATVHRYAGKYDNAERTLADALSLQQRLPGDHPERRPFVQLRGDLNFFKGDVAAARRDWAEGLRIAERTLRPGHPEVALSLRQVSVGDRAFGDIREAQARLERALPIAEAALPSCHPEVSGVMNDLAQGFMDMGNFTDALRRYTTALSIRERCLGRNNQRTATVVHNLALLRAQMGDLGESERLHRRAMQMWSAGLGPTHPYVATAIDALADVVAAQGRSQEARQLLERALAMRTKSLGAGHPDVAWTRSNLAQVLERGGNRRLALAQVNEALAIYQKNPGGDPEHLTRTLALKGAIELRAAEPGAAVATLTEAWSARRQLHGDLHPLTATSLVSLAAAEWANGNTAPAFRNAIDGERIAQDHLRETVRYLPDRPSLAYAASRARGLDLGLSMLAAGEPVDAQAAFDALVRSRGIVLDELAARARAASAVPSSSTVQTLAAARQRLATLIVRSVRGDEAVPRALIDDAQRAKERAEQAAAEDTAEALLDRRTAAAGWADVVRALPEGTALASFVRYDRATLSSSPAGRSLRTAPAYLVFVVAAGDRKLSVVPLGSAATIDSLVAAWREPFVAAVDAPGAVSTAGTATSERIAGVRLRRQVWDPLVPRLGGASRVLIVPDGALNLVNFAALPTGTRQYLVESATLHVLTAERDLVPAPAAAPGRGLLAVGAAAYGRSPSIPPTAVPPASRGQDPGCAPAGALQFEPLPGTRGEMRDISRVWTTVNPAAPGSAEPLSTLEGAAATEAAVVQASAGRRVVHYATHGFVLGDPCAAPGTRGVGGLVPARVGDPLQNPLALAGLAFAGANTRRRSASADDGILTGEEVASMNLQGTEWAVLSACDTGLGPISASEGVLGLRRAFQIAGARTVIMSLWPVEDEAARQWMRALYEAKFQRGMSTADAVRHAQVTMLNARRTRGQSTHPRHWAPFVAAGEWN